MDDPGELCQNVPAMSGNPWDALAPLFASDEGSVEPPIGVADNILLAWPPVIDLLINRLGTLRGKRVLNFACGAGHFCRRLAMLGAMPLGLDHSPAMIQAAQKIAVPSTSLRLGSVDQLQPGEMFDAITCIMGLPFISEPDEVLQAWSRHIAPKGVVAVVVFNPGFVRELLRSGHLFRDFDSVDRPRRGVLDLTGKNPVPVFIRYAEEYAYLFETHGFQLIFEARPPFTPEFLAEYPQPFSTQVPEFLIMGFRYQPARPTAATGPA